MGFLPVQAVVLLLLLLLLLLFPFGDNFYAVSSSLILV